MHLYSLVLSGDSAPVNTNALHLQSSIYYLVETIFCLIFGLNNLKLKGYFLQIV